MEAEGFGWFNEAEVGFVGRSIPFFVVAGVTAGDEVLPGAWAATGAGHDVIEGEFSGVENFLAILAGVFIAHEDVLAG